MYAKIGSCQEFFLFKKRETLPRVMFFCYNKNGDNMKNKIIIIGVIVLLIIFVGVGSLLGYKAYQQWRIANAEIIF